MSRDALQESLSAVMDNEADELELRRVLNAFDDAETRDTWSRYQVARAVMHKDLLIPRLDIAAAVSAALADEAVPAKAARGPWRSLGRLAVAASVTWPYWLVCACTTRTRSPVPNWPSKPSSRSWPLRRSRVQLFWLATRKAPTQRVRWPMACFKGNPAGRISVCQAICASTLRNRL
jgi:hypothetical protein